MKNNIRKMYNKVSFKVQKNSPEILIGVGIATTVAATVMACKATLKISDILEEVEQTQNNMDYALEHGYNYLVIPYWEEKNNQYQDSIDEKIKQLLSI